jgi:hypothetical protein
MLKKEINFQQSPRDSLEEMLEAGKRWSGSPEIEIETIPEPKKSGREFIEEMVETWANRSRAPAKPEVKPEPEPGSPAAFLKEMLEAGKAYEGKPVHDKPDTKAWTDEQKMEACPRNNGKGYARGVKKANIRKMPNGDTQILPRYCNMCEECYKHHAQELKERMKYFDAKAKHDTKEAGGGHWRKAIVEDDKESKALKKKVSRNQENRHVEFAAEQPGHNEVWTYVDNDEPEPEKYGEMGDPEQDIDFDEVYKNNRETGKKFSVGKAFKSSAPASKEDTIRIIVPEIVVDMTDSDRAEKIMRETNYIKEVETPKEAQSAYAYEFKYVIAELEKEGIEVLAVDHTHYNIAPDRLLEEWNRKCAWWMSINAPLDSEESGANVDIKNRLYYPDNKKEAHKEPLD